MTTGKKDVFAQGGRLHGFLHDFWNVKGRASRLDWAIQTCKRFGRSSHTIVERLQSFSKEKEGNNGNTRFEPDVRSQYREKDGHQINEVYKPCGSLIGTYSILLEFRDELADAESAKMQELRDDLVKLDEILGDHFPAKALLLDEPGTTPPKKPVAASDPFIAKAIEVFAQLLLIDETAFSRIGQYFFPGRFNPEAPPATPLVQHYYTYRFSSEARQVVKTATILHSPTVTQPLCQFSNIYKRSPGDGVREVKGIVFPLQRMIYFVGRLGDMTGGTLGAGMKIMVTDRHYDVPRDHHGLMLTFDDDAQVAARFVMLPVDADSYDEGSLGISDINKIRREIGKANSEAIRNFIYFTLEGRVLHKKSGKNRGKQREIPQADVAQMGMTFNLVQKLANEKEASFNPTAHEDYTFNAALKIWRKGEAKVG